MRYISRFWWVLAAVLWLGDSCQLRGDADLQAFSINNYSGYIIASDTGALLRNRDAIRATATVRFFTTNTVLAMENYRVVFSLTDAKQQPVNIIDENGHTNQSFTIPQVIAYSRAIRSITNAIDAAVKPAERLNPYEQYTLHAQISQQKGFVYEWLHESASDGPRTYYHFTNTVSGDAGYNVIATITNAAFARSYMIDTVAGKNTLPVTVNYVLSRYDEFANTPQSTAVTAYMEVILRETGNTAATVALKSAVFPLTHAVLTHTTHKLLGTPLPSETAFSDTVELELADGVQLDSVNKQYEVSVKISHKDNPGSLALTPGNQVVGASRRILHFNGDLYFGDIRSRFYSATNDPAPLAVALGQYVTTTLAVDKQQGRVADPVLPMQFPLYHTYGNGTPLSVRLRANGDAYLASGSVTLTPPYTPDYGTEARVRFLRGPIQLDATGGKCNLTVALPYGLGFRMDMAARLLSGIGGFFNVPLNDNLVPKVDQHYSTNQFYLCEESKPVWIEASDLTWHVADGTFDIKPTGKIYYVRRTEVESLEKMQVLIPDPVALVKKSNEKYYRFVKDLTSATVKVITDAKGSACMTYSCTLSNGQFRAHFPYDAALAWNGAAALSVVEDQAESSGSYLSGASASLSYRRDCTDAGCPGGAAGLQSLVFLPENGTLRFTPDGGLSADGALDNPQGLKWGYVPSKAEFAQKTDKFTNTTFHMSGCYLRGDVTTLPMTDRPATMLFTGVKAGNASIFERPGTDGYRTNGLADYAGVNFRVTANGSQQGESLLAGVPTGLYPLTARSKYYARYAGISGVHEAVKFVKKFLLYGYPMNFSNYGLAYLDSQNVDSRTQGYLSVPEPAGFDQEFEKLKFSCLGALMSAEVPAASSNKFLVYWQADFVPHAIQFQRNTDASCDPSQGYLVLGVSA